MILIENLRDSGENGRKKTEREGASNALRRPAGRRAWRAPSCRREAV